MLGPIDVTENTDSTYTSSHLSQFAWSEDPEGSAGLLYVEFQGGNQYLYEGVNESYFRDMADRSFTPGVYSSSAGQYFQSEIVDFFDERGIDYHTFDEMLD
jgi:hypothetical protein